MQSIAATQTVLAAAAARPALSSRSSCKAALAPRCVCSSAVCFIHVYHHVTALQKPRLSSPCTSSARRRAPSFGGARYGLYAHNEKNDTDALWRSHGAPYAAGGKGPPEASSLNVVGL